MTAAGVLLLVFLVAILIVQFVQIGVRNAQENEYKQLIEQYKTDREKDELDLEFYQTERGLYKLALKNGWKTPQN